MPLLIDEEPAALSVAELCRRCRAETERYRRGETQDDRYAFELFRRALVRRDELCWEELYTIYYEQVAGWCLRAGAGAEIDREEMVSLTWQKFWRNYTPEKLAGAAGVASVLRYLKLCARSVVVDGERARPAARSLDEMPFERAGTDLSPEEVQTDQAARAAFWRLVEEHLRDERERVLVVLTFELGLRSAEIQVRRPDLFPTVADVYRLTRNVLERLRRSRGLHDWLEEELAP